MFEECKKCFRKLSYSATQILIFENFLLHRSEFKIWNLQYEDKKNVKTLSSRHGETVFSLEKLVLTKSSKLFHNFWTPKLQKSFLKSFSTQIGFWPKIFQTNIEMVILYPTQQIFVFPFLPLGVYIFNRSTSCTLERACKSRKASKTNEQINKKIKLAKKIFLSSSPYTVYSTDTWY